VEQGLAAVQGFESDPLVATHMSPTAGTFGAVGGGGDEDEGGAGDTPTGTSEAPPPLVGTPWPGLPFVGLPAVAAPLDAEEGVAPLAGEPVPPLGPTALAPVPDDPSEEVVPPAHGVVAALSVTGSERKPPRPTALTVSRYIVPHLRFVNVAQVNAV